MNKGTIMNNCPFCGRQAIVMNPQGVPVCTYHREAFLELKCVCGKWLEILNGKYGVYGNCLKCGNMSLAKALTINNVMKPENTPPERRVNTVVKSTDL
ncbi:MAG TPA: hypothetical protein VEC16_02080 [Alphaproteobacteria bacterium]|nr:hypothetical protein [Alphaproteobacteria bacterium]